MKFILIGHGNFASGLKSNMETIAGIQEDLVAIDFTDDLNESLLSDLLRDRLTDDSVIIVDILGGTPFKVAATLKQDFNNVSLVYGASVNAILEAFLQRDARPSELVDIIITTTQNGVGHFDTIVVKQNKVEGGI